MWTATVRSVKREGGNLVVEYECRTPLGESVVGLVRGDDLTPETVERHVAARIASLERRDAGQAALFAMVGKRVEVSAHQGR